MEVMAQRLRVDCSVPGAICYASTQNTKKSKAKNLAAIHCPVTFPKNLSEACHPRGRYHRFAAFNDQSLIECLSVISPKAHANALSSARLEMPYFTFPVDRATKGSRLKSLTTGTRITADQRSALRERQSVQCPL